MTYYDKLWHIMKYHNIFVIMTYHEMSWQNMTFCHKNKIKTFFVAKTRNYDIFVAKIYDYLLIDSYWGFPGLIDSPTSYATLYGFNTYKKKWRFGRVLSMTDRQTDSQTRKDRSRSGAQWNHQSDKIITLDKFHLMKSITLHGLLNECREKERNPWKMFCATQFQRKWK